MALAVPVGLDVALVPAEAERCVRQLNDEQIEIRLRRQAMHRHVHHLDAADGVDRHVCARLDKQAAASALADRAI